MKSVAQILKAKADQTIYTIAPTASVFEAVKLMAEKNIGALVVMEGEKVVGIITERDYARKIVLMARSSKDTPVRDIMTASAMYVSPVQRSEECMALMTENRVRHLLVIDNGKLIGLVSIGDLVQRHHLGAKIHHPTTRTLHHRGAELNACDLRMASGFFQDRHRLIGFIQRVHRDVCDKLAADHRGGESAKIDTSVSELLRQFGGSARSVPAHDSNRVQGLGDVETDLLRRQRFPDHPVAA